MGSVARDQLETVSEPQMQPGPGRGHKAPISNEKKKNHRRDGSFSQRTGPGRGHKSAESNGKKTKGNDCPSFSERTAKLLRAINRAPESVHKLYEQEGRWAS